MRLVILEDEKIVEATKAVNNKNRTKEDEMSLWVTTCDTIHLMYKIPYANGISFFFFGQLLMHEMFVCVYIFYHSMSSNPTKDISQGIEVYVCTCNQLKEAHTEDQRVTMIESKWMNEWMWIKREIFIE